MSKLAMKKDEGSARKLCFPQCFFLHTPSSPQKVKLGIHIYGWPGGQADHYAGRFRLELRTARQAFAWRCELDLSAIDTPSNNVHASTYALPPCIELRQDQQSIPQ